MLKVTQSNPDYVRERHRSFDDVDDPDVLDVYLSACNGEYGMLIAHHSSYNRGLKVES
jgi:hypothetical protein